MENANNSFLKSFSPLVLRISVTASFVIIALVAFIIYTAMQVHSESDVTYRQESIFLGAGFAASKPDVEVFDNMETTKVIVMTFEVDKVTPTPTPVFDPSGDDVWLKLADCESHKNWKADTGNGYYGGLQFSLGAWASVGGNGKPSEAGAEEQIAKGKILQAHRGWGPWGGCSEKLGLS